MQEDDCVTVFNKFYPVGAIYFRWIPVRIDRGNKSAQRRQSCSKARYRIISNTVGPMGDEKGGGGQIYSMGNSRFTRGSRHPIDSIMPCGAYRFVYLCAPLCTPDDITKLSQRQCQRRRPCRVEHIDTRSDMLRMA